ncbi:hypothetical protein, partial [Stieleria sp.]|uniref:hypothetical protein n=1 Tax=Stieleria sp. TaxID=2795976 RepID=UPI0035623435
GLSFKFQVSSFKFQVSSFKFQVFKFQVSSFQVFKFSSFQVFKFSSFQVFRFQVSGFRFQVSGFRFQVSGFRFLQYFPVIHFLVSVSSAPSQLSAPPFSARLPNRSHPSRLFFPTLATSGLASFALKLLLNRFSLLRQRHQRA